ncbi:autotransporter domain-containing protein [Desulfuromonas acetoxidans]|uniref:autotransporter outer membrane beta-barrel domain-containing protein n=1 Tax=Desulfuromonas acetoxidans TaxID=891 RepID=UPI00292F4B40|nr:autotransporter domain-containing protein [Desulfuromonas acetoxidans]
MEKLYIIIPFLMMGLFLPALGLANEILEIGQFQVELLAPGESASTANGMSITGTTIWTEEQKTALISSLDILNLSLANSAARPVRIAMAWSDNLPQQILGNSGSSHFLYPTSGELKTTAEAAWRDGDPTDYAPGTADIAINYNSAFDFHYGKGLPGYFVDFRSAVTHEIIHGLGITSGYSQSSGFYGVTRWSSLIEDSDGNRAEYRTLGTPNPLTVLGPQGTLLWLGDYANATHGGPVPIQTFVDEFLPGSSMVHPAPMGELMSWTGNFGEKSRAPNKLLLDMFRDLGWEINMDFYNSFGPTSYRNNTTLESAEVFLSDYDYSYAFYVNGDNNEIVQSGVLESRGDFSDTLRLAGRNNTLEVIGSLTAKGDYSTALYAVGEQNHIQVSGNITAQGEDSVGIYLPQWYYSYNTLILSGATIQAETAVYSPYANPLFILNDCRINGDIITDTFSGVAFGGIWDFNTDEVISLVPDFSFRFDDDIIGNWIGHLGTGELSLNGNAEFSSLTIHEPATLKGTGTIYGPVINYGTIAPGNSIGTLTIDGNYTQLAGSVLEVEAGEGAADSLLVSGTADVQGGSLVVIPEGYLTSGDYTVLEANVLQGTFDELLSPAVFSVAYDDTEINNLTLDIARNSYASLAATIDQNNLSQRLDAIRPNASGDTAEILNTIDGLTLPALHGALNDLMPRFHNSVTSASLDTIHQHSALLAQQIDSELSPQLQRHVWLRLVADNARYEETVHSPAFRAKTNGLMMGIEQQIASGLRIGMAGAYSNVDLHELDFASTADHLSWDGYLYARWDDEVKNGGWFAQTILNSGTDSYDTKRTIAFLGRQAKSEHDGGHGSLSGHGGYRFTVDSWSIIPSFGLEYLWLQENAFSEHEAEGASLHVSSKDSQRFCSQTGLKIEHSSTFEEIRLVSQLAALWNHAFDDETEHTQAQLIDSEEHFSIQGRDSAQDSVELSLALHAIFVNGITTRLGYQRTLQNHGGYRSSQVNFGLEWAL